MNMRWIPASVVVGALLAVTGCAGTDEATTRPAVTVTVTAPVQSAASVEPSPTQRESLPPAEALEIDYDPAFISAQVRDHFSDDMVQHYEDLVQAIIDGKEKIRVPDSVFEDGTSWLVTRYLQHANPLGYLAGMPGILEGGKYVIFDYPHSTPDNHAELVKAVELETERIIADNLTVESNETTALLALYRHLAQSTNYNMDGEAVDTYGVLMLSDGMCTGFSGSLAWLAGQAGFDSGYILSWTPEEGSDATEGHAWPAGVLGGSYFHFDPTWENGDNGGASLDYFGMTDEERFVGGELSPDDVFLLEDQGLPVAKATDDRFAALRGVSSYEIDATNNTVRLDYVTGGSALFDTATGETQDL